MREVKIDERSELHSITNHRDDYAHSAARSPRAYLRKLRSAAPKCVTGRAVFFLERCDRLLRYMRFAPDGLTAELRQRRGEFIDVDAPVAAAFQRAAEGNDGWKNRMPVPASRQMPDLRPRIRIENVMTFRKNAML